MGHGGTAPRAARAVARRPDDLAEEGERPKTRSQRTLASCTARWSRWSHMCRRRARHRARRRCAARARRGRRRGRASGRRRPPAPARAIPAARPRAPNERRRRRAGRGTRAARVPSRARGGRGRAASPRTRRITAAALRDMAASRARGPGPRRASSAGGCVVGEPVAPRPDGARSPATISSAEHAVRTWKWSSCTPPGCGCTITASARRMVSAGSPRASAHSTSIACTTSLTKIHWMRASGSSSSASHSSHSRSTSKRSQRPCASSRARPSAPTWTKPGLSTGAPSSVVT